MSSTGARAHRSRENHTIDMEFLIKSMYESPGLNPKSYHEMLTEDIKKRGDTHGVSYAQTCRDIVNIRKNVYQNAGVNLKSKQLDSLYNYEHLMMVTLAELEKRINEDRSVEEVTIEDIQIKKDDYSSLSYEEKMVYNRIKGMMKKTSRKVTTIPAGSDIKDMVITAAKMQERIDKLLGLEAARKVDTRNTHMHNFEQMTSEDIKDRFKMLGITSQEKLRDFIQDIDFTPITKKAKK